VVKKVTLIKIDSLFLKDNNIKTILSTTPNYTICVVWTVWGSTESLGYDQILKKTIKRRE